MKPATVKLYRKRFNEGYDVQTDDDELYNYVWYKLKTPTISDDNTTSSVATTVIITSSVAAAISISSVTTSFSTTTNTTNVVSSFATTSCNTRVDEQNIESTASKVVLPKSQEKMLPSLDEILIYPKPTKEVKKQKGGTSVMSKHLSGEQMIRFFEER